MTEKDNVSMATVQIKPDYAASEVYSTASEAPPAYKRQANSVKIAKITAFTVIISSFILGSFILASSYLQAKASCDQVQALDSVLEKELMLETLQQVNKEYPRAEPLVGRESTNNDIDLQSIEKETTKKEERKEQQVPNESDSSFSDSEETEDLQKIPNKVPLELDLSDLAAALLQNNQKSRMNCVVERKRAEEILDSPSKTVALPFGMNLTTDPKKARVTGERISIFCEGGNENKDQQQEQGRHNNRESDDDDDDDVEEIAENFRPMFFPIQPIPFGRTPNQSPLTHMPQRMPPPQFQQLPIRPPMPPQMMEAPQQMQYQPHQQTVRIHVQEIPLRAIHMADDVPVQISAAGRGQEMPQYQVQKVPLDVALNRAGITSEDLRNIQHMAEERIADELRRLAAEEAAEAANGSDNVNSAEQESSAQSSSSEQEQRQTHQQTQQQTQQQQQQQQRPPQHIQVQIQREPQQPIAPQHLVLQHQQLPEQPKDTMVPPMPDQPQTMLQYGRAAYGRSVVMPVSIPVPMMQQPEMSDENNDSERPHYVQPRSIRSTDNIFKSESKRVKKCACDCNC